MFYKSIHLLSLIVLLLLCSACSAVNINIDNVDGSLRAIAKMAMTDRGMELTIPRGENLRSDEYLRISLTQTGRDITIRFEGRDPDDHHQSVQEEHHFPAPIGIEATQETMAVVVSPRANIMLDRIIVQIEGFSRDDLTPDILLGVSLSDDNPGLVLEDQRIISSEGISYVKELRSISESNSDDSRSVVYEHVHVDALLADFDDEHFVPAIELCYEYTPPEEGMPVSIAQAYASGEQHYPDPAPPLARIDMLPAAGAAQQGRSFELRLRPGTHRVYLYPEMLRGSDDLLGFRHDNTDARLRSVRVRSIPRESQSTEIYIPEPLPIDLGGLLNYSPAQWRNEDFELFSWSVFPEVLIFDFANFQVQSDFFRRLSYFVEKVGFRGNLLTDAQLAGRHGWNAHNYRPTDLARFFNSARETGFALNERELQLEKLLLFHGLLIQEGGELSAGEGAIISLTQDPAQMWGSRYLFLNHESLHGLFYNMSELQERSRQLWFALDDDVRRYIERYFSYVGYDPADEYLMINEFQAYMLQQDISEIRWYVDDRMGGRLEDRHPELKDFVQRVRGLAGSQAFAAAEQLQSIIYQKHGFIAGDLLDLVSIRSDQP